MAPYSYGLTAPYSYGQTAPMATARRPATAPDAAGSGLAGGGGYGPEYGCDKRPRTWATTGTKTTAAPRGADPTATAPMAMARRPEKPLKTAIQEIK
jgi:hypothetical protein